MDNTLITWIAEVIGLAGAAFLGGMKGGRKAHKTLEAKVDYITTFLVDRFGMPKPPQGNGKVIELGLADPPEVVNYKEQRRET